MQEKLENDILVHSMTQNRYSRNERDGVIWEYVVQVR